MDFWDHSDWREIPQNDPTADVPTFITPHLVKHVQPNVNKTDIDAQTTSRKVYIINRKVILFHKTEKS